MDPQQFFDAVIAKFLRMAKEKNRSLTPWDDYDAGWLFNRLRDEYEELMKPVLIGRTYVGDPVYDITKIDQDELIDVANFCMFLWLKLESEKKDV